MAQGQQEQGQQEQAQQVQGQQELELALEHQAQLVLEKAKLKWAALQFESQPMPEQQLHPQQP